MGFAVAEGPQGESDWYNFDALNIPSHHPARTEMDTFYMARGEGDNRPPHVLRTHTSPVQIRSMQEQGAPIRIICPGRVYRADYDQTHTPMFHQVEGLAIDKDISMANLKWVLEEFFSAYFGTKVKTRFRASHFPFTEPSAEVDIQCSFEGGQVKVGEGDGWLEVLGSGMVHQHFMLVDNFSVLENVVLDEDRVPDFDDGSKTENTRAAYPIHFISNASETGCAPVPHTIIMLTADAFGVMPPLARLTPAQAMYHFLSGYTAKVAGTEKGVTEPQATFSTCFGAPFLPRHPSEYGNLLKKLIADHDVDCWLVNTGWTGGAYGTGHRMPIKATRTLLQAALSGELKDAGFRTDPNFGFEVPVAVPGVDTTILTPRETWDDKAAYDVQASKLVQMFVDNFGSFENHVDGTVLNAAPALRSAAE